MPTSSHAHDGGSEPNAKRGDASLPKALWGKSSGHGGLNPCGPLYHRLVEEGYDVHVSHPKETRYIADAHIKSDWVDSIVLAKLLRLNSLLLNYMPPEEIAELWEKVRRIALPVRECVHSL